MWPCMRSQINVVTRIRRGLSVSGRERVVASVYMFDMLYVLLSCPPHPMSSDIH